MADSGGNIPPGAEGSKERRTTNEDIGKVYKNDLLDIDEKSEEKTGVQEMDNDTLPESDAELSGFSSVGTFGGESEEVTSDNEAQCSSDVLRSISHISDDNREAIDKNKEKISSVQGRDEKIEAQMNNENPITHILEDKEIRQDLQYSIENGSAMDDPCSDITKYTLKQIGNKYLLLVNGSQPWRIPQLDGKSNVSLSDECILINGELVYFIHNTDGKINVIEVREVLSEGIKNENVKCSSTKNSENVGEENAQKVRSTCPDAEKWLSRKAADMGKADKSNSQVSHAEGDSVDSGINKITDQMEGLDFEEEVVAFTRALVGSERITEGLDLKLECCVSHPHFVANWFKDGKPLENSKRLKPVSSGKTHSLEIQNVTLADSGKFTIKVGKIQSTSTVKVEEDYVVFTQELVRSEKIEEGLDLKLKCCVSHPHLVANWFKDGKPLEGNERLKPVSSGKTHSLEIQNVTLADSGEYTIKVGKIQSTSTVIVKASLTIPVTKPLIWQVMQVEKTEKIKEFEKSYGTLSFSEDVLTLKSKPNKANDTRFDDIADVFRSFIEAMTPMEFEVISIKDEFIANVPDWIEEIENVWKKKCCTFIPKEKTIIVYVDSYEKVKNVQHQFLVKLGIIKHSGRKRRVADNTPSVMSKADDTPSVMRVAGNTPTVMRVAGNTPTVMMRADFEWKRDAKHLEAYKTSEVIQVYVYEANILKLPVDCIVNAANDTLNHGGGVAYAIAKGAGQELTDEGYRYIRNNGKLSVGEAVATTAGKLPYQCVIHAVGPCWSDYWPHNDKNVERVETDLYNAVFNSFNVADERDLQSIALPAISAAIFMVPVDLCVCKYVQATVDYSRLNSMKTSLKEIHFIDIDPRLIELIQREFKTVLTEGKESTYQRRGHVKMAPEKRYTYRSPKPYNDISSQTCGKSEDNSWQTQTESRRREKDTDLGTYPIWMGKMEMKTEGSKHVYHFGGKDRHRLIVYTSVIVQVRNSAIVVPVSESGTLGNIGMAVLNEINTHLHTNYKKELETNLPPHLKTGDVATTKGYGSRFTHIIHVVLPNMRTGNFPSTKRRKILIAAYQNIFFEAEKKKDVEIVATPLLEIDEKQRDEVDLGACSFLDGYCEFLSKTKSLGLPHFDIHLVLQYSPYTQRVLSAFDDFVRKQQEAVQNAEAAAEKEN